MTCSRGGCAPAEARGTKGGPPAYYEAGHTMGFHKPSLVKLKKDIATLMNPNATPDPK